jgi:hypothetical protein
VGDGGVCLSAARFARFIVAGQVIIRTLIVAQSDEQRGLAMGAQTVNRAFIACGGLHLVALSCHDGEGRWCSRWKVDVISWNKTNAAALSTKSHQPSTVLEHLRYALSVEAVRTHNLDRSEKEPTERIQEHVSGTKFEVLYFCGSSSIQVLRVQLLSTTSLHPSALARYSRSRARFRNKIT